MFIGIEWTSFEHDEQFQFAVLEGEAVSCLLVSALVLHTSEMMNIWRPNPPARETYGQFKSFFFFCGEKKILLDVR